MSLIDNNVEVGLKFYVYQIIAVLIIWGGMTYFLDAIQGGARIIYYAVTSWLLFLIVMVIKKWIAEKNKE